MTRAELFAFLPYGNGCVVLMPEYMFIDESVLTILSKRKRVHTRLHERIGNFSAMFRKHFGQNSRSDNTLRNGGWPREGEYVSEGVAGVGARSYVLIEAEMGWEGTNLVII